MITWNDQQLFVMDAHTHLGRLSAPGRVGMPPVFGAEQMLKSMDAAGVDAVVTFPFGTPHSDYAELNQLCLDAQAIAPDRICAYARIQPLRGTETIKDLKVLIEAGIRGVKFHPLRDGTYCVSDLRLMAPLMELIAEAGIPVIFHSGESWVCTPTQIGSIARHFPDVPIVIGHSGLMEQNRDALEIAERQANIYLDTSITWPPAFVGEAVRSVGRDRVLLGSDHPACPFGWEIEKVVHYAGIDPGDLPFVLGLNMARLLGLATYGSGRAVSLGDPRTR